MSRTDEEIKQANAIFAVYKAEIDKRELSNTDNYDKNILTLSSAGLAISLTLLKDIVSKEGPTFVVFLYLSWTFFGLAILSTIASFLISNKALTKQLSIAERYYIDGDQNAFSEKNSWGKFTSLLNWFSGSFFILAIISVIVFGLTNFSKRLVVDIDNSKNCVVSDLNEGHVVPKMQQHPIDKGAAIPAMPKVPAPKPSPVNPVVAPNSPATPTTTRP